MQIKKQKKCKDQYIYMDLTLYIRYFYYFRGEAQTYSSFERSTRVLHI